MEEVEERVVSGVQITPSGCTLHVGLGYHIPRYTSPNDIRIKHK
jgi:hypothetical protein